MESPPRHQEDEYPFDDTPEHVECGMETDGLCYAEVCSEACPLYRIWDEIFSEES